ncbi:MAG: dockerin type I repeat-containing protein, partial [Clostridia bacterium]|nr:dockerin type I repeat-containing protein [Clostridia bacterium]
YTLIVRGDLNGDGSLKLNDLAMAQKIFLELSEPENLKVKAADLNKDGEIDINDLSKLQKMFLGM